MKIQYVSSDSDGSYHDFALAEPVAINVFPVCPSYVATWMTVPCRIGLFPHLDTVAQENKKSFLPPEWHGDEECSMYKQPLDWPLWLRTKFWVKISIYVNQINKYTCCGSCLKNLLITRRAIWHELIIAREEKEAEIFFGLLLGFITYFFFPALNGIQVSSMIQRTGSRFTWCIGAGGILYLSSSKPSKPEPGFPPVVVNLLA